MEAVAGKPEFTENIACGQAKVAHSKDYKTENS